MKILVDHLRKCKEPFLIFSLLWCKLDFAAKAGGDETTVDCARGYACEIAAMRILRKYDSGEVLTALTNDYKAFAEDDQPSNAPQSQNKRNTSTGQRPLGERSPLLNVDAAFEDPSSRTRSSSGLFAGLVEDLERSSSKDRIGGDSFTALEVAIVAEAKYFTSAHIVQDILTEIWHGDIIFWNDISEHGKKKAQYYNKDVDARFCNFARLRVPQYSFIIESLNFFILAALYLVVVVDREYRALGWVEVLLALWFLGFTYQEYDQFREAGTATFYLANPFNYFDLGMIVVALAWIVLRVIGVAEQNPYIVGRSYDVLSLQGVLLVPRLFSFLSLTPYFGTLFPCLKRLVVDFVQFLVLIVALFTGFLVTFSVLGRNQYSVSQICWMLIRVFYGGSNIGFDAMRSLHPIFGPPLMIVFVTFSQILLTTALISILSSSFSKVMDNARSEYHFLFATTCLEASKSDHMVILSPPFNLLALFLVRPLRLILPSNHIVLRTVKIWILRVTHAPYVLLFSLYEKSPFCPSMSDARRRRMEKSGGGGDGGGGVGGGCRGGLSTVVRPTSGMGRLGSTLIGPAGVIAPVHPLDQDTDDEEGMDTGVMIADASGNLDQETRTRIERMEQQIDRMRHLLETLVAEKTKSR